MLDGSYSTYGAFYTCVRAQRLDLRQKKWGNLRKTDGKPLLFAKTVVPLHRQKEQAARHRISSETIGKDDCFRLVVIFIVLGF